MYFKTKHRLNYHLGSLSGALPLLGGWIGADHVTNSLIAQNVMTHPMLISIPIISTLYMWAWQNIHFAFIVQRYLSDYQKIEYKLDPSLVDHDKLYRSMNLFLVFNVMIVAAWLSAFFLDHDQSETGNKLIDFYKSKVNIQNLKDFFENNVFSQKIGDLPFLFFVMYFGVFQFAYLIGKFSHVRKSHFNVQHDLKQFSKLRKMNYQLILYFFFNLLILNGIIWRGRNQKKESENQN